MFPQGFFLCQSQKELKVLINDKLTLEPQTTTGN